MSQERYFRSVFQGLACALILGASGHAGDVGVVSYEAELRLHPERNAVDTRVCCLLRNDGTEDVGRLSFDVLAREERCKARTAVRGIWQKADGKWGALTFQHGREGQDTSGTKLIGVTLASKLAGGKTAEIKLEYTWEATDPTNTRDNYRPFATLGNGEKELCLLCDYAWLPSVRRKEEPNQAGKTNRFAKEIKPSWTIRIQAPDDYTVVALGGRHVRTEKHEGSTISEWRSVRPIYPQLMAGRFQKHAVPGGSAQVVFYLPKGYDHGLVPRIGKELSAAYEIFRDMFGPLEGDEIHIGVSSAGQGGHGGYLSFTMDTGMLGREITEERLPMILEIMRHELAHSWWGWSVSSYGPGTKFLRESLAHFANACFVEETTRQDRLAADMAKLFWMGMQTDVLCGPDTDSERAAYLKGPVVLHVLRSEMGREKFSAVLRRFASRHHGDWATMTDFIATCNEVSGTDWTEFFNQWCFGAGIPDYRLEKLDSQKHGDAWTTEITIRNAGGATITCPLELRMAEGNLRKTFRIEPSKASTLTFPSPKEVIQAVIDPDHRTCQGSGRECRLKMLGVGNVDMEWIWYWRGVVLAEDGKYREAIADITRAMALHGHPAFSYSRGVAYLKSGDTRPARSDFVDFIDAIVKRNDAHRSLVYPGLLSAKEDTQKEQLNRILQALTGQRFTTHDQWQSWWHAHRESFQPAPSASLLAPGGESA